MGFVQAVVDHGSPEQRRQVETDFGGPGVRAAAVLIQERGFAFDVGALATQATRTDDGFLLRGAKSFVPLASGCRDLLVLARCDGELEAFLVPAETPGVEVGIPKGALGLRALGVADVRFHDVALPATALLGEGAVYDRESLISSARVGLCAIQTGVARAVFEHITPYTKDRIAHGSALAKKQSVAFRLADMFIDIPSMRWMVWRAASALEQGRPAIREARLAQIHCAEKAVAIADEGIQLMGGHGYMRANPVERWYRDAQTLSLLEGVVGV